MSHSCLRLLASRQGTISSPIANSCPLFGAFHFILFALIKHPLHSPFPASLYPLRGFEYGTQSYNIYHCCIHNFPDTASLWISRVSSQTESRIAESLGDWKHLMMMQLLPVFENASRQFLKLLIERLVEIVMVCAWLYASEPSVRAIAETSKRMDHKKSRCT